MNERNCQACRYSKPAGYRQVICGKDNKFHVELYSCPYFREKEDVPRTCGTCNCLVDQDTDAGGGICKLTGNFHRFNKLCDR